MGWMSAICDAHKKKVGVEQLYNSVHRKFNQLGIRRVGDKMRLSSPGERERNAGGHKSGGQYVAVLFGLQLSLTYNPFNKVRGIFF